MQCNCIEDLKESAKEKLIGKQEVVKEETEVRCLEEQFYFSGPTGMSLNFQVAYRRIKNNGEPYARMVKDKIKVTCGFCPICGKPITEEE